MKAKNSIQGISPDISVILMCFGILIACPIRIFQMLKNIDPTTGFFDNYSTFSVTLLYCVLGIAAFLIILLTFLSARVPASIAPKGKRIPLGLASILFSGSLFYDAIQNYLPQEQSTATIIQNAQSLSTLHHAHAIFAFLSACYFLIFAIAYLKGSAVQKKVKILSLAPLAWAIMRVLERITVIISIVRVSELLLELCAFVFLMLFFMTFARVISEVNGEGSMWSVISCGCAAALFILTYSIPRLMLTVTGNAANLVSGYPLSFADIATAVFIITFVITTLRCGYKVEDVKMMNEEISAELEESEEDGTAPFEYNQDGNIKISKESSAEGSEN